MFAWKCPVLVLSRNALRVKKAQGTAEGISTCVVKGAKRGTSRISLKTNVPVRKETMDTARGGSTTKTPSCDCS
jgi:hypothetical protein